jgi:hypothetical protein
MPLPAARRRMPTSGGGGGNRTHVPRRPVLGLYARSPSIGVTAIAPADRIGHGQPDSFSSRTGRAAVSRPACCVSPRPPAGVGISASLPSFQLGSESEVRVGTSVFRRDLRGPRTSARHPGRDSVRSMPVRMFRSHGGTVLTVADRDLSSEASAPGSDASCRKRRAGRGADTPATFTFSRRHPYHGDGISFWPIVGPALRV